MNKSLKKRAEKRLYKIYKQFKNKATMLQLNEKIYLYILYYLLIVD